MEMDVDFKRKNIEDVIKLNNGAALLYLKKKSDLNLDGFVPGTKKTYMEMAIDYGADKVVDVLLEEDKNISSEKKVQEALPYLIGAEKRALLCAENDRAHLQKINQFLAIASSLMNVCSKVQYSFKKGTVQTPVVRYLKSYQPELS